MVLWMVVVIAWVMVGVISVGDLVVVVRWCLVVCLLCDVRHGARCSIVLVVLRLLVLYLSVSA